MMKKFLPVIVFLLVCVLHVFSQNVIPTPTPKPTEDNDVVKISTNLVQVDVTVTDKNDRIIRDLKPNELQIYQNGKKQELSNFLFIPSTRETTEGQKQVQSESGAQVPVPPSELKAANVKRAIALVVDDLNLSFLSVNSVRDALRKFVDFQMRDGDLVAIIRTGAGIGALQQFTNDKRQLYAAMEKIRYNAMGTGNIGSFAPLEYKGEIEESLPISSDAQKKADDQFRASIFATGTLGALNYVVRGMADLPGRKSIMLMSDGFALFTQDANGDRDSTRVYDAIKALVDKANRAAVVIYTMDPRGLITTGLTAADEVGMRSAAEIRQTESDRIDQVFDSQEGLLYIAKETGGTAFLNNNDLSSGVRKILDDQSYYLVGYVPDDETFDSKLNKFNNISIKVTRPGTKVRYRSGFYGVTDEKQHSGAEKKTANRIANALTSPFAVNDISLRLNALFGNSPVDGSYIRSLLHIRPQDLTYTDTQGGGKKGAFDVIAVAFGDNGNAVDQLSKTIAFTVKKENLDAYMRDGFVGDFVFPIKKPGAYQLRVAIKDHGSEKVGSANQFVEIPDLKKNRLTLSGVALENVSFEIWKKRNTEALRRPDPRTTAMTDTAVRQFKKGSVLNYGMSVYNAKFELEQRPNLKSQIRLFRDGKPFFEGKAIPITLSGRPDRRMIPFSASLNLGSEMPAGEYVMEIIVTNELGREKPKTAVQFVQFEVVD